MTEDEFDFCKYCDELPIITIEGDREGDTAYIAGCSYRSVWRTAKV